MNIAELILRKTLPVVVNSFNQPGYLQNIVKKFQNNGFSNIYILDQNSTSNILLELYKRFSLSKDVTVLFLGNNLGPKYFFESGLFKIYFPNIPLIYTDPDLDFDDLDSNFVTNLFNLSKKYMVAKVGPALQIPQSHEIASTTITHPDNPATLCTIAEWESQFWINSLEPDIYAAGIDTTLHLFNPQFFSDMSDFYKAIRVATPGVIVKHLPWYRDNNLVSNEENDFYITNKVWGWWT